MSRPTAVNECTIIRHHLVFVGFIEEIFDMLIICNNKPIPSSTSHQNIPFGRPCTFAFKIKRFLDDSLVFSLPRVIHGLILKSLVSGTDVHANHTILVPIRRELIQMSLNRFGGSKNFLQEQVINVILTS